MSRSGKQARLAHRRAQAGGEAAARSPKLKWPLRAVVGGKHVEVVPGVEVWRDELECGHLIRIATDMIGERYPARRRCGECYREAQAAAVLGGHDG